MGCNQADRRVFLECGLSPPLHRVLARPCRFPFYWTVVLLILAARSCAVDDAVAPAVDRGDVRSHIASILRQEAARAPAQGVSILRSLTTRPMAPGRVVVRLDADITDACLHGIAATGAVVRGVSARRHSATVETALDQLAALASVPGVRSVHPAWRPLLLTPPTPDGADTVIGTNRVRSSYGATGAGRTIGIISDSINMTGFMSGGTVVRARPLPGEPCQAPRRNRRERCLLPFRLCHSANPSRQDSGHR